MLVTLSAGRPPQRHLITFTKAELNAILSLYSYQVAKGAWRDYAVDVTRDLAAVSMFKSAHEQPVASVLKLPANTSTGFVFEIFLDKKRLSRTPDLHKALEPLQESLLN
jgi:hypothetical protein